MWKRREETNIPPVHTLSSLQQPIIEKEVAVALYSSCIILALLMLALLALFSLTCHPVTVKGWLGPKFWQRGKLNSSATSVYLNLLLLTVSFA